MGNRVEDRTTPDLEGNQISCGALSSLQSNARSAWDAETTPSWGRVQAGPRSGKQSGGLFEDWTGGAPDGRGPVCDRGA